ncbi:argininosuccinate lyase [Buchnera aphidicola (Ceratovacuna keduensis)]|uniref:argininosuccinate lyase n=1 Tax=Buchnera aphidicola TaxID=9 RepID=UPI0031B8894A
MFLWGGRFSKKSNNNFLNFNRSLDFDYILVKQDIISLIAWSKFLLSSKIINKIEQSSIENCLNEIKNDLKNNFSIILRSDCEDIHTWLEKELIFRIGKVAKKLRTGKSRNEQITTSLKMWCKDSVKKLISYLKKMQLNILYLSEKYIDVVMPGYTHLQIAQPILFSHLCLSYYEMINRDKIRLSNLLKTFNFCPLGSGAISGISYKIDRYKIAKEIFFSDITKNSIDSVSDRDYVVEFLSCISIGMMHLSRICEDLIFFNTSEANFIELSDIISTGSSLMPQKKNPDILELIRGKCGRVYGSLISILVMLKGIPMSYNKDMQEDKECLFDSINTWKNCINMISLVFKNISINYNNCLKSVENSYANSTDLLDYLVKKGVSFKNSHEIVGKIVLYAIKKKKYLNQINISTLKSFSIFFEDDVYDYISINKVLERKNSIGGTSKNQVLNSIKLAKKRI